MIKMSSLLGLVEYGSEDEEEDATQELSSSASKPNENTVKEISEVNKITISSSPETEEEMQIVSISKTLMSYQTPAATESPSIPAVPVKKLMDDIPPASAEPPDRETLETIHRYLEAKRLHEFDLSDNIKSNKEFGNPSILTKVVKHYDIDEIGSNYPAELFDPHKYTLDDFEESIRRRSVLQASVRQPINVKKEAAPLHAAVEAALSQLQTAQAVNAAGERKRKSKWG